MADTGPQGWVADPFGLHEARYFSAGQPTKLVRDGAVESFDEPPSSPEELAAAPTREFARIPAVAAMEPGPSRPSLPDDANPWAPPPGPARFPRSRPWDGVGWAAIAVLAAAAVVIGFVVAETPKPASTLDTGSAATVAFVSRAAQATMAKGTADITLSGTVQTGGQAVAVHGTGVYGLRSDEALIDTTYSTAGRMTTEKEILVDGSVYIAFSVNGTIEALPGGKTWIQVVAPQAGPGAAGLTNGNVPTVLSALEGQGNTVRGLGTKLIGGEVCSGYSVTVAGQAPAPVTIVIWIDSQHLLREMTMNMQLNVGANAATANMAMDFSYSGTPVQVTPPAPSSVISLSSFLKSAGQGGAP